MVNYIAISLKLILMRCFFVILLLFFILSDLLCQGVSNVKFRQDGNNIIVNYNLKSNKPTEVKLYYSIDGGLNFGDELNDVSGDVGSGVLPGNEKEIIWDVLSSKKYLYGDNIVFKVEVDINYIEMVFVEGGSFQMGNFATEPDESPVHEVFLNDFYISKFEITQKRWAEIMDRNPSYHKKKNSNYPVESISVEDIRTFIKKLNDTLGQNFRLPTEAEWEYAARGGQKETKTIYSGSDNLDEVAWQYNNSRANTHDVGSMKPNELGIHDMSGNVWEICSDFYSEDYYNRSPKSNPAGPISGDALVKRGGAFDSKEIKCSVTNRGSVGIKRRSRINGFRLVRDAE